MSKELPQADSHLIVQYVQVLDASAIISKADARGIITYANDNFCAVSGYSREELIGKPHRIVNSGFHPKEFIKNMWDTIQAGKVWRGEVCNKGKNGEFYWVDTFIYPMTNEDGKITEYFSFRIDITKRKDIENELDAQRAKTVANAQLAALGEMSAGVSHEINNPLAIILGKAGQIRTWLKRNPNDLEKVFSNVEGIENAVTRISRIVKGLKAFARQSDKDPFDKVSLQNVFDEIMVLSKEKFQLESIDLKVNLKSDILVRARSHQVGQVLINLLNNARDAVRDLPSKWILVNIESLEGLARITIQDSGSGIPPEIAAKIMNPFFTTKEIGKGTGLGLSISKGIIEEHGGKFYLDQNQPHTTFVIEIPLFQELRAAS